MSAKKWVFVTDRADSHVARFDRLFSGLSDSYELLSLALDDAGKISVRDSGKTFSGWSAVRDYLKGADVVISGPLDSVSIPLQAVTIPMWGFRGQPMSWSAQRVLPL